MKSKSGKSAAWGQLPALLLLVTGSAVFANTDPVAVDDSMTAPRDQTTTTLDGGAASVLDNDTDPEGDALSVFSVQTEPVHGVLNLNADGTFSYTHDGSFNLSDRFTYRICDDGDPVRCTNSGTDGTVHIAIDLGADGFCSSPDLAIPDNDPVTGVTDTIDVVVSDTLGDLDIVLLIEHSWVGDLTATVTHDGVSVDLLARPGLPGLDEFGCGEADIDAVFDDEAAAAAEDTCRAQQPAIFGTVNLSPNGVLSDFDGQDSVGSWDLQVTDAADGDTGSLLRWCLVPTFGAVPNVPPTAVGDTMTAARGQVTTLLDGGVASVLANDFDAGGGDTLTVNTTPIEAPRSGVLTLSADGTFSYAHDGSATISDHFVYRVCDNGTPSLCADGRVDIFVDPGAGAYCSAPEAAIPDGFSEVSDTISISDAGDLVDMDVVVYIEHTWVGDLEASLTHDDATSVLLLDRPGTILDPPDDYGCDGDDVDAVFDDAAAGAAEDACAPAVPTIDGRFRPTGSLAGFIAEPLAGEWRLTVADRLEDDTGTFRRWCLLPTLGAPPNTPPDAFDDAIEVSKGGTATELVGGATSVLDNDSDGEGDTLSVTTTPLEAPAHGTLSLNADGTFSYTHGDGYTTRDRFVYEVCDDGEPVECAQAAVTIAVDLSVDPLCSRPAAAIPDNDAVGGVSDSIVFGDNGAVADVNLLLHIDHSFVGDLQAVLTHDGSAVTVLDRPGEPADPAGCDGDNIDAVFDDEGAMPAEDMCSADDPVIFGAVTPSEALSAYDAGNVAGTWSLTVYDVAAPDTGTLVQWCVLPAIEPNRAPTADSQAVMTAEDSAIAITLTGADLDYDPLVFTIQDAPAHGALTGSPPDVTYTPAADYFGADSFTFTTFDGALSSAPATVSITVNGENDAPVANPDAVGTDEDTPVGMILTGSDVDGDPLTFNIVTPPAHGALSGSPPTITYTPDADYNGADSFAFEAFDGALASAPAVVTITVNAVNDPPVADDQAVSTDEEVAKEITLTAGDVDDGDTLIFSIVTPPGHGSLDDSALPVVTYTPDADYAGPDSFTFKANDGAADSNIATVSITVNGINDPPVAVGEQIAVQKGLSTSELVGGGTSLLSNDSDPEGDNLSVSPVAAPPPANGSVTLNGDGTFTYTHDNSLTTTDSFGYEVCDDGAPSECDTAIVTVAIDLSSSPYCNAPDAAIPDDDVEIGLADSMIIENAGAITDLRLLLYLDHSRVGDLWAAVTHEDTATDAELLDRPGVPALGALGCENDDINAVFDDAAGIAAEDLCESTPPAIAGPVLAVDLLSLFDGESINGTWTLTLTDGAPGESGTLRQWCLVPGIAGNTPPVADDQSVTTDEDTEKAITLTGSDIDLDALTFDIVTPPGNGSLLGSAPNVTYVPDENYFGADSFTFTANDGAADSGIATVDITVNPVNDPPVADDQAVGTDEDVPVPITLTGSDVEGDALEFVLVTLPAHGALTGSPPNVTYTPDPMYFGMDSFTFRVNDGADDSEIATVTIDVGSVNDPPTADDQSVGTDEDTPLEITLSGSDPDGDPLTYIIVAAPAHGSLNETLLPVVTYTPDADYHGPDSFTFRVNDGAVDSGIATVGITVNPVNDPPVAVAESISVDKGETTSVLDGGATSLLSNDSDIEGDDLSVTPTPVSGPSSGTLSLNADGTFSYTHDDSMTATDSFVYEVCDDGVPSECDTALVSITIDTGVLPDVIYANGFESE